MHHVTPFKHFSGYTMAGIFHTSKLRHRSFCRGTNSGTCIFPLSDARRHFTPQTQRRTGVLLRRICAAVSRVRVRIIYQTDSGVKTCSSDFYVYIMLYLCISAPLYEASCSKGSEKSISASATVAKSALHGCLQLSRHPCRLWLYYKQSPKNN